MQRIRIFVLLAGLCVALATPASAQVITSGTVAATGAKVCAATYNVASVGLEVSGTWSGQLDVTGTVGGATFSSVTLSSNATSFTSNGQAYVANGAGWTTICVTGSSWVSGTATVTFGRGYGGGSGSGGGSSASVGATGAAAPSSADQIGVAVGSNLVAVTGFSLGSQVAVPVAIVDSTGAQITPNTQDPCEAQTRTQVVVSQTASTKWVTGTASQKIYICSLHLVTATQQNIALVDDATGADACTTSPNGLAGGSTAGAGWNFAANSGISLGNGAKWVIATTTNQNDFCILQSGGGQVSGSFTYVKQ